MSYLEIVRIQVDLILNDFVALVSKKRIYYIKLLKILVIAIMIVAIMLVTAKKFIF